ncbi:hypothetical protein G6F56_008416 [Rhizopus delemar]|nr:hypothetical protein G6F56_008416 [Rhizopus delemar]
MGRGLTKPPMCRDYMEKGYCMSGDTCPFDHGKDRIIVEDTNNSNYVPPNGNSTMPNRGGFNQQPVNINEAYDPERASLLPANNTTTQFDMRGSMQRRGGFRGGRGGRGGFRNQAGNSTNTTLIVEKIPLESCQISIVNDFFAKFGTITNISVQPHAQKAVIQYGTRAEAERAYTCPDAVFDNRFVKVYWSKDETAAIPVTGANATSANATPVNATPVNATPVNATSANATSVNEMPEQQENTQKRKADEPDPEAVAARAAEIAKIREEKHKKHQEHMKAILDIQKKREQQLQQQIAEQKRLFEKLSSSSSMSTEEKTEILKQLKAIQADIDISKNTAPTLPSATEATDDKEQTAADLQKKLEHLEAEASFLGTDNPYSNRGGYSARGRGSLPRARGGFTRMSLDNRTTKIEVKDIPQDTTEEELRGHFENYGEVTLFEMSPSEAIVQYSQRYMAEKAMFYAPNFPKGKLQLSWSYKTNTTSTNPTGSSEPAVTGTDTSTDPSTTPTETL